MHIQNTYEFKRIQRIIDSVHYSHNSQINHAYHKGFLMALLAEAALRDSRVLDIAEAAKERLLRRGFVEGLPKNGRGG